MLLAFFGTCDLGLLIGFTRGSLFWHWGRPHFLNAKPPRPGRATGGSGCWVGLFADGSIGGGFGDWLGSLVLVLLRSFFRKKNQKPLAVDVLLHGTTFFRQGMTFYAVKEKDIPKSLHHRMVEKIRNVVVVLGHNTKSVVTCYYNRNAFKYLKRKSKELKK